MANRIETPYLNPLAFVEVEPVQIPQYLSMHMDDYLHAGRLNTWQSGLYFQPWILDDSISLQFQTNAGGISIQVVDCHLAPYLTFNMTQKQRSKYQPDLFIYESTIALNVLPEGIYYFVATVGTKKLISEPIDLRAGYENTILLSYKNKKYKDDIIFETGFSPTIRIHSLLQMKAPSSKDTLWEDQVLDMVMIQSQPFETWNFIVFGENGGIPDWMIKKISRIQGCSDVRYDGKFFTRNAEAKWEEISDIGNHSLKGYQIELREQVNRNSKVISVEEDTNFDLSVMYITDSKGFGDLSGQDSGNLIQIHDIE